MICELKYVVLHEAAPFDLSPDVRGNDDAYLIEELILPLLMQTVQCPQQSGRVCFVR